MKRFPGEPQHFWLVAIIVGLFAMLLEMAPLTASAEGFFVTRWLKSKLEKPVGRGFNPANVYRSTSSLPADMRRVAVFPLTADGSDAESLAALETHGEILVQELGRSYAFEVVRISPEKLRRWGGRALWKAGEPLPQDLLIKVREHYSCQAVLFAEMTHFHAYGPLQIGWRLKLAETRRGEIVWAADEFFDAGVPEVATAATRYAQAAQHQSDASGSSDKLVLSSPQRFAQYTLSALFATLPRR